MGEAEGKKNSEKLTNSQFIQDCILQGRFSLCVYLPPFLQNMTLRVAAHSQACHLKCKKQTNKQGGEPTLEVQSSYVDSVPRACYKLAALVQPSTPSFSGWKSPHLPPSQVYGFCTHFTFLLSICKSPGFSIRP